MNEELSQVQDENIFSDVTSEEENLFDSEPEDTPVEETEPVTEEPFLKVTYDKEEKGLSREEAKDFAEKGMNYDRMRDKYNNLYSQLDKLANLNGLSVDDYLGRLNDTQHDYMVNQELEKLKESYPNDSDEMLREVATRRVSETLQRREQSALQKQQGEADAQQAKVERDVELFFQEYPEFRNQSPDSLDPKVYDYVKQGYTLLEAYNKWTREQANSPEAQAKEKVSRQNEENKKRSLGNTTNTSSVAQDDFLSGFLKG